MARFSPWPRDFHNRNKKRKRTGQGWWVCLQCLTHPPPFPESPFCWSLGCSDLQGGGSFATALRGPSQGTADISRVLFYPVAKLAPYSKVPGRGRNQPDGAALRPCRPGEGPVTFPTQRWALVLGVGGRQGGQQRSHSTSSVGSPRATPWTGLLRAHSRGRKPPAAPGPGFRALPCGSPPLRL